MIFILTQTTQQTAAALNGAGPAPAVLAVAVGLLMTLLLLHELLRHAGSLALRALPQAFALGVVPLLFMLALVLAVQFYTW